MPRPKRHSDEEIILAARAALLHSGAGTSLQQIAGRLGLSHAAILQRFGSKRRLVIEALRPRNGFRWPSWIQEHPTAETVDSALLEICQELERHLTEHAPRMHVLQSVGIPPSEVFCHGQVPPVEATLVLTEWIERGISVGTFRACDAAAAASGLVGAIFGRCFLSELSQSEQSALPVREECEERPALTLKVPVGSIEGLVELVLIGILSPQR
ncbi:MAG: helix-turn-helix domain-containing protein [Myxococcota bacterium]|nr:helix-turn-helix domain-containing protein [Myxococcota bacterium]